MTGRRVDAAVELGKHRGRGRWLAFALAGLALLVIGIAIGSKIARGPRRTVTVTRPSPRRVAQPGRHASGSYPRTRQGAITAASAYVSALAGPALLDTGRVREILQAIASRKDRDQLIAAYDEAAAQARQQLGVGTVPTPVVIVRAAPVGYRVAQFTSNAATISIWRVGIVGSGASVTPAQSWRTETVSLLWQDGTWKVASLVSQPGPTPPLDTAAISTPAELFSSIPRYEKFSHVGP